MALCLFSYLGVETASVAAAKVRDPDRNVPKSTIYGTLATAVVYLLSLIAVFGAVPTAALGKSAAPYSTAADAMVGGGTWAGYLVAGCVIVSGLGALNGWTMICAEMPLAAAKDGLFPELFGRLSSAGVPAAGVIISTVFASVAMAASFAGSTGHDVFNTLLYMSGITAAIPYAFSAAAQIKWRVVDKREMHGQRFARDVHRGRGRARVLRAVHLVLAQHRRRNRPRPSGCRSSWPASPSSSASRYTSRSGRA